MYTVDSHYVTVYDILYRNNFAQKNLVWLRFASILNGSWRHRLSTVDRRAFTVQGPVVWNSLRTTSAHSRTMSPLDSAWKSGFSLATSVLSALETLWQLCYINSHLPLPLPLWVPTAQNYCQSDPLPVKFKTTDGDQIFNVQIAVT